MALMDIFGVEADKKGNSGMRFIGLLVLLVGLVLFAGSIAIMFFSATASSIIPGFTLFSGYMTGFMGLGVGAGLLVLSILMLYFGFSLWSERQWAFYFALAGSLFGVVTGIIQIVMSIVSLSLYSALTGVISVAIWGLFLWYFMSIHRNINRQVCGNKFWKYLCK